MTSQSPSYRGYRFPREIISQAGWLYHRFCLGFRDVEDPLAGEDDGYLRDDRHTCYSTQQYENNRAEVSHQSTRQRERQMPRSSRNNSCNWEARGSMTCPKCHAELATVAYESIKVNRCIGCDGLWFDMLELEHLKAIAGSEEIDIGDPVLGRALNSRDQINCPVCDTQMVRMVDVRQPHIRYESCPTCYGIFFDAGEFQDYKEEGVLDFFRALFARERT